MVGVPDCPWLACIPSGSRDLAGGPERRRQVRTLAPDIRFRVEFAPGYRPTEALADDEWPEDLTSTCSSTRARCWRSPGAWEVAFKAAARKLHLREPPMPWFLGLSERYELRELPLDAHVACAAAALPPIHRDSFERVLVALAQMHALTVLTSDENIPKYPGVRTLW